MANEKQKEQSSVSFEDALTQLETIVSLLEKGDVPLAKLVQKFEEGKQLLTVCQNQLKEAEFKLEQLKTDSSGFQFENMELPVNRGSLA